MDSPYSINKSSLMKPAHRAGGTPTSGTSDPTAVAAEDGDARRSVATER